MERTDLPFLPVAELARQIEKKQVSPVEAVEAYLERIERLDRRLNAYLTVCQDEARQAAREAERAMARGHYRGPLYGIPFAAKDQLYTQGIRTTGGSPIFEHFVPDEDVAVITKLKAAGAILLGKLNMTEFATTGFSHRFNTPRNPWTWNATPVAPAAARVLAPQPFFARPPLGKTRAVPSASRLPGVA
jgi:Asp-tRNA(Asn)/Glu-tRNA(Gln) amidotransferase A subunit family amidase